MRGLKRWCLACIIAASLIANGFAKSFAEENLESRLKIGAHYYSWYKQSDVNQFIYTPLVCLEYSYESGNPKLVEEQIKQATDNNIDFFTIEWWGKETHGENNFFNGFRKAKNQDKIKYCIFYDTVEMAKTTFNNKSLDFSNLTFVEKVNSDFEHLNLTYFNDENYLKLESKPVVFMYAAHSFSGNYNGVLNSLRDRYNLFLVGDTFYWKKSKFNNKEKDVISSFDAIFTYTLHNNKWINDGENMDSYATKLLLLSPTYFLNYKSEIPKIMAGTGKPVEFWPTAMPGFNDTFTGRGNKVIARSVEGFKKSLDLAYSSIPENSNYPTILISTFNEHFESTGIEASVEEGHAFLNQLNKKFEYLFLK